MQKVIVYIDGFNLYFGLREAYNRKFHWLDLVKLSNSLLKPEQQLIAVKYFTSRVHGVPSKIKRQDTYLEALTSLPLCHTYFGQFMVNDHNCPKCGNVEHIPSEKMTDVNIATHILVDAFENSFDVALLISGDSDLSGPVSEIKRLFPEKKVIVAFPPKRTSFILKTVASGYFRIGRSKFEQSQFPDSITKSDGFILKRPSSWK